MRKFFFGDLTFLTDVLKKNFTIKRRIFAGNQLFRVRDNAKNKLEKTSETFQFLFLNPSIHSICGFF